ncbi:hypothetical protein ACROYT_G020561 [Oculina patagonica]
MNACTTSLCGVYFLICCFATFFVAGRPMAHAACVNEFQDDCDDDDAEEMHHVVRRSIPNPSTVSQSLKADFNPVIHNVTYYNIGDTISFQLNLTHNQSVAVDLKNNLKVVLWSQFLEPVQNSWSVLAGVGSITGGPQFNSSAISFDVTTLGSADLVSVTFGAKVTDSIQPLSNLYFAVLVTGQDGGGDNYHYGPAPSQPTLYAVFPTVSMTRNSYSYLWVSNTTGYTMTITMPHLDFSLLVEISTNINDFSFMELHNVQVKSVGSNVKTSGGGIPAAPVSYDSSDEAPFNDRAVLDFGNLTVRGSDASLNKIVIEYNVTIRDHPMLANDSKHWVGAGMRSGYQMLWVGQEALYVYKSEPSLTATFTTTNDTASNRYLIGDKLFVNWTVNHMENTSYEDAQNVRVSFYSNTLQILEGTYDEPGGSDQPLTINSHFQSGEIAVATLAKGQQITGDLVLIVSDKISPLEPLDIFLQLNYQNLRGDDKLNTTHKPSPPFVAGVPGFSLKLNNSTNQIRIGGRAKFSFNILMRRIVSTLKVEVILPVNETSIMSLVSLRVVQVGTNIKNNTALSQITAQLTSTVGDQKLYDRGTIDFGTVENTIGTVDHPDNKIMLEFEIVVNDHAHVTNGSKHWVGVGVRGGKRMMWIGDVALIADVPVDRRPILQVQATCELPGTKLPCSEATTLERSSKVHFNGTIYHAEQSQQYADNVNVFWMIPPYVKYTKLDHDPELTYQQTQQGPKFSFDNRMHFLDRFSFSVEGNLDPDGLMPPGDTYAVSPIQLSYSPFSMSAVYGAPPVPVSLKFKSPGDGAPVETPSELSEVYSRGFLVDPTNDILYVCQKSKDRVKSSCYSTADKTYSWIAMDQQVCYVIGQDGDDLYGIACNGRAYMRKQGTQGAWYGIDKHVWEEAKNSNIQENLVTIEENYSHTDNPESAKTKGTSTIWGGNAKGVYIKSGNYWQLKAQWKCCGN